MGDKRDRAEKLLKAVCKRAFRGILTRKHRYTVMSRKWVEQIGQRYEARRKRISSSPVLVRKDSKGAHLE